MLIITTTNNSLNPATVTKSPCYLRPKLTQNESIWLTVSVVEDLRVLWVTAEHMRDLVEINLYWPFSFLLLTLIPPPRCWEQHEGHAWLPCMDPYISHM